MDIATLLESHRKHMLDHAASLYNKDEAEEGAEAVQVMAMTHDRATTKTLLDLYRSGVPVNGEVKPLGQAALTTPPPTPSRKVKAGSKKARERALKAVETRRKNLAAKAAAGQGNLAPAGNDTEQLPQGGGQ